MSDCVHECIFYLHFCIMTPHFSLSSYPSSLFLSLCTTSCTFCHQDTPIHLSSPFFLSLHLTVFEPDVLKVFHHRHRFSVLWPLQKKRQQAREKLFVGSDPESIPCTEKQTDTDTERSATVASVTTIRNKVADPEHEVL